MEVRLVNEKLSEEWIRLLVLQLQESSCKLQRLTLRNNGLGPKFAVVLADAVQLNSSLVQIDLRNNSIGPHGSLCLANALTVNKSVEKLCLQNCSLRTEGLKPWCEILNGTNPTLVDFDVSNNGIDDEGAIALSNAFEKRTATPGLRLNLKHNTITSRGASELCIRVRDTGTILDLRLEGNDIVMGDKHLKNLTLYLRHNKQTIRRKRLELLLDRISQSEIEVCEFRDVDIPLIDAERLAACLSETKSVTELAFRSNSLTCDGIRSIADALRDHPTIRRLSIENANLNSEAWEIISRTTKTLEHVAISNALAINDSSFPLYHKLSHRAATLWHRTLSTTSNLITIDLTNTGIDDITAGVILPAFSWHVRLERLVLCNNEISDHLVCCIAISILKCLSLQHLDLSLNRFSLPGLVPLAKELSKTTLSCVVLGRFEKFDATIEQLVAYAVKSTTLMSLEVSAKTGSRNWQSTMERLRSSLARNRLEVPEDSIRKDARIRRIRIQYMSRRVAASLALEATRIALILIQRRLQMGAEDARSVLLERKSGLRRQIYLYSLVSTTTFVSFGTLRAESKIKGNY